jgi:serine/threonine protein kinase
VLPWETIVKILRDCASVLRFLHTHPDGCIVHRDIKVRIMLVEICRHNKVRLLHSEPEP